MPQVRLDEIPVSTFDVVAVVAYLALALVWPVYMTLDAFVFEPRRRRYEDALLSARKAERLLAGCDHFVDVKVALRIAPLLVVKVTNRLRFRDRPCPLCGESPKTSNVFST